MTYPVSENLSLSSSQSLASGKDSQGGEQEIRLVIAQVTDRVEQLLARHEALIRTNALLSEQLRATTADRDSLRSRLNAARARVEALIARLPDNATSAPYSQPGALK